MRLHIYFLDRNPQDAAAYHCDRHVGEKLLHATQLMATCYRLMEPETHLEYRGTFDVDQPWVKWICKSPRHYYWVCDLAIALGLEFKMRYGKIHASSLVLTKCDKMFGAPKRLRDMEPIWEDPDQSELQLEYQNVDVIKAYRDYYFSKEQIIPLLYYRGTRPNPMLEL